jgi:hypothetical protein
MKKLKSSNNGNLAPLRWERGWGEASTEISVFYRRYLYQYSFPYKIN